MPLERPEHSPAEQACFDLWKASATQGLNALEGWLAAKDYPLDGRTMSLVELAEPAHEYGVQGQRVVFVTWSLPVAAREGRLVHLDEANRFVYSTGAFHPRRAFHHDNIILPSVGVALGKAPKPSMRQPVPPAILRLVAQWRTGILAHTTAEDTSLRECVVCGENSASSHCCAVCDCSWHAECCKQIMSKFDAELCELLDSKDLVNFGDTDLPIPLRAEGACRPPLCDLCYRYIRAC